MILELSYLADEVFMVLACAVRDGQERKSVVWRENCEKYAQILLL